MEKKNKMVYTHLYIKYTNSNFITSIFNRKFTHIQYMKVVVFYFYYVKVDIKVQVLLIEVIKQVTESPSEMTQQVSIPHVF